ncbi:MAG TPA: 1-acyl-sn-glycerol-3-phosphate acyltransferase [Gemmatimonadaceae bacterium]|nr:1-acyl-sn-glycerol-3-phosphate acyltransferase [Gemmatimonadaceae bacterium]
MPELWYRALLHVVARIYYRRVRVVRLTPFPAGERPVLYVGLHRNGAVDGILYKSAFPRAVFLISRQLVRSWFARLFFTGIPVTRDKDEHEPSSRRDNARALATAVDHVVAGGDLFVFPEGTSDLGPRHLPFKPGAAKVLAGAMERGVTPVVLPLGIFYEAAPTFRSDVCIVVGAPIDVAQCAAIEDQRRQVAALMARITTGLEEIAVEATDACALRRIETLAALADDDMGETRWRRQRTLAARTLPAPVDERWRHLAREIETRRTAVDRAGIPRFSRRGAIWNAGWIGVQLLLVSLAFLGNWFPLAAAWRAGRQLSDAPNTIAIWRILIGVPVTAVWWLGIAIAATAWRSAWLLPAYAAITLLGLVAYPELCERWPKLSNSFRNASRDDVAAIAGWVRDVAA